MTATFFGHKDTPKSIEPVLRSTIIELIEKQNVTEFYVGNQGNFDIMVHRQLRELSLIYPINYSVVWAYLPNKNNGSENTIYPEGLESVPKRFAISHRNKWMINQSDIVVTYFARSFGGAWQFKLAADKKRKIIIELNDK